MPRRKSKGSGRVKGRSTRGMGNVHGRVSEVAVGAAEEVQRCEGIEQAAQGRDGCQTGGGSAAKILVGGEQQGGGGIGLLLEGSFEVGWLSCQRRRRLTGKPFGGHNRIALGELVLRFPKLLLGQFDGGACRFRTGCDA